MSDSKSGLVPVEELNDLDKKFLDYLQCNEKKSLDFKKVQEYINNGASLDLYNKFISKNTFCDLDKEFLEYVFYHSNVPNTVVNNGFDIKKIQEYINRGVNLNSYNEQKYTPLILACWNNFINNDLNLEFTKMLLDNKANVNTPDLMLLSTPLNIAVTNSNIILKNSGEYKKFKLIKLLLEKKADTEIQDNDGWTPLMNAVKFSNIKVVRLLLDYKANVNAIDKKYGWTTLMHSASRLPNNSKSITKITKLLLECKANTEIKNKNGKTAMDLAVKFINRSSGMNIVKLFMEYGLKIEKPYNIILKYNKPGIRDYTFFKKHIFFGIIIDPEYCSNIVSKLNENYQDTNNSQFQIFNKKIRKKVLEYFNSVRNVTKLNKDIVNIISEYMGFIFEKKG